MRKTLNVHDMPNLGTKFCKFILVITLICINLPAELVYANSSLSFYEMTSEQEVIYKLLWPQSTKVYQMEISDNESKEQHFSVKLEKLTANGWETEEFVDKVTVSALNITFTLDQPVKLSYSYDNVNFTNFEMESYLLPDQKSLNEQGEFLKIDWLDDIRLEDGTNIIALMSVIKIENMYDVEEEQNLDYDSLRNIEELFDNTFALTIEIN